MASRPYLTKPAAQSDFRRIRSTTRPSPTIYYALSVPVDQNVTGGRSSIIEPTLKFRPFSKLLPLTQCCFLMGYFYSALNWLPIGISVSFLMRRSPRPFREWHTAMAAHRTLARPRIFVTSRDRNCICTNVSPSALRQSLLTMITLCRQPS